MSQEFTKIARTEEIPAGSMKSVELSGERVVVANVEGDYYAFGDECPHAGGLLSEGYIEGKSVECPLHGSLFNMSTGIPETPPADESVAVYQVKVEGNDILIAPS